MEDCVTGACATERGVKEEGVKAEVEARSERAVTNFMVDVYWVIISLKTKIMGFSVLWRRFQMGNERSMDLWYWSFNVRRKRSAMFSFPATGRWAEIELMDCTHHIG